jgi:Protein of unknown function (DUF3352)
MAKKGIITAALLVTAAGAGFAGYKYLHGDSQPIDLASVIPADAYFAAYVSNEPEAWSKLQKFGTPAAQKIITQQLTEVQQKFLAGTKMDYVKDLQPWMGNVMMAAVPDASGKSGEPQIIVAIGVKDKLKALDFANKLKSQSKNPTREIDYKGVKITAEKVGKDATTSLLKSWGVPAALMTSADVKDEAFSALIDNELVVSSHQQSVERAIDTAKGSQSLASKVGNDWIKGDALQLKQPIMAFYVPDYANGVKQLLKSGKDPITLDAATESEMKKIQSLGGGIAIDDAGIRMNIVTKTDGTTISIPNGSSKQVSSFPTDTFMIVGGNGIAQVWTEVTRIAALNPETQKAFTEARSSFTKSTQLDLDKDVFAWMGGEYSMAMMPVSTGITAMAGFGGTLAIESTDKATTDNTMSKLTKLAKDAGLQSEQRQVDGKNITDLKGPTGNILSYGWLNDKSMYLSVGDGLLEKIAKPTGETLDRNANFTAAFGTLPQDRQSYLYVDIEKISTLFGPKLAMLSSKSIPPDVDAIVSSVRGIGITSVQVDKNTYRSESLLSLKSAQ